MGIEIQVNNLEDMCSLMCDNVIPDYPNAEYGILTQTLEAEDIKESLAQQFKTTSENVELSNNVTAIVRSIVKYEEDK